MSPGEQPTFASRCRPTDIPHGAWLFMSTGEANSRGSVHVASTLSPEPASILVIFFYIDYILKYYVLAYIKYRLPRLIIFKTYKNYLMCNECFGCMCICAWLREHWCITYMPAANSGQKKALGPPKLGLWVLVSHHGGSGNQTLVLHKSSQCSRPNLQ